MIGKVVIINGVKQIEALTADTGTGAPVGSYLYMEKKSNPSGYLYCDGSTFDETKYPALYQYLGTNVLPDWRELGAKGAEKNTTLIFDSTETNPTTGQAGTQNHDVFAQGEFKDDQLQDHKHKFGWKDNPNSDVESMNNSSNLSWVGLPAIGMGNGNQTPPFQIKGVFDGRVGTVTRGKSRAVFIYIKATSGLTENQQENVLNTINDNLSYSTEEHFTGKYFAVGNTKKKIYSVTFFLSGAHANTSLGGGVYSLELGTVTNDLDLLLKMDCVVDLTGAGYYVCIPRTVYTRTQATELYLTNDKKLSIYDTAATTYYNAVATIEYTKTTD